MPHSPFETNFFYDIFKFDPEHENRLASRESGRLEFKESFNLGSADDYAKTMAAFANAAGGYVVYGVKDSPRELIGLRSDNFHNLDPARLTQVLNERMAPEIHLEQLTHSVRGKRVGVIYVHEAFRKPVVCTRTSSIAMR